MISLEDFLDWYHQFEAQITDASAVVQGTDYEKEFFRIHDQNT